MEFASTITNYISALVNPAPAPSRKNDMPVQYQIVCDVCATQGRIDLGNILAQCASEDERKTAHETVDILVKHNALRPLYESVYERLPNLNLMHLLAKADQLLALRRGLQNA